MARESPTKLDFSHVNLLILLIADSAQTEYRSTFHCVSVCVQALHLNFSQLFDVGHENHIFSESISSRLITLTTLTT